MATSTLPTIPDQTPREGTSTERVEPGWRAGPRAPASLAERIGRVTLNLLRLALGVEFLWAFFDKTFGLGYSTAGAKAWVNGGSPTKGFLSGVESGPLRGVFTSIAGAPLTNWLFMLGLLGIGVALLLGVALRPAAVSGAVLLLLMWLASWPPAATAGGQPTGSTNPLVDDHIISALAIVVVATYAAHSAGVLGRWWSEKSVVIRLPWLR